MELARFTERPAAKAAASSAALIRPLIMYSVPTSTASPTVAIVNVSMIAFKMSAMPFSLAWLIFLMAILQDMLREYRVGVDMMENKLMLLMSAYISEIRV